MTLTGMHRWVDRGHEIMGGSRQHHAVYLWGGTPYLNALHDDGSLSPGSSGAYDG